MCKTIVAFNWYSLLQSYRFIWNQLLELPATRSQSNICSFDKPSVLILHKKQLKHLSTFSQVVYHTPPRFPAEVIDCIRQGLSLLFRRLGLHDFARIDGWFLPSPVSSLPSVENSEKFGNTKYGTVLFTDINLVSIFISLFVLKFGSCPAVSSASYLLYSL